MEYIQIILKIKLCYLGSIYILIVGSILSPGCQTMDHAAVNTVAHATHKGDVTWYMLVNIRALCNINSNSNCLLHYNVLHGRPRSDPSIQT